MLDEEFRSFESCLDRLDRPITLFPRTEFGVARSRLLFVTTGVLSAPSKRKSR
jgi:hypothetical protein